MSADSGRRRRWFILALIFSALVLNYFDRQIVSILKPTLKDELRLDDAGYARVVNAFTVCYAVGYPLAGWLVDRFGAGRLMLTGVVAWSLACLGVGFSRTAGGFMAFRALLGLAEPTAFPAQLRVVTIWFPGRLRATANSLCVAGTSIGAIIAPPLVAWLTLNISWHAAFVVPGVVGLLLAALWAAVYRDPPPQLLAEALASSDGADGAFTWPQIWRTRTLWAILLCRLISDPVWYFCLFWLPGYLQEESGLSLSHMGLVGWIPFLASDLGAIGSSAWSDWLVRRGLKPLTARKAMLAGAAALAPMVALTPHLPNYVATLAVFSVVGAASLSWLFTLSVVVAETFPAANVGSVLGIAAGCGAVGGMVFNYYVGEMLQTAGAAQIFAVMAALHPIAAIILWTLVRPEHPPADPLAPTNLAPAPAP
ncbi:MAG: MFS transporter [Planctomycetota bacterium]|nr:MAG: MFS transporter [Planctomycetota bacterium]